MKKQWFIAGCTALSLVVFANAEVSGQGVYESKCKMCHSLGRPSDMSQVKAPPMARVAGKLRQDFNGDTERMIAFIKDYIVHPDKSKARCMPRALDRFGVMPPIGAGMSKEEIDAVATWLATEVKGMGPMHGGGKGRGMGKGMGKGMMRCAPGKCGM